MQEMCVNGKAHGLRCPPGRGSRGNLLARRAPERTADQPTGPIGLFFQQQAVCLRTRKGGEQLRNIAILQNVAHRQQNHPLMMRHMAAHDAHGLTLRARGGKIGGFKHAQRPLHPQRHEAQQVLKRALQIHGQGQEGGIGRDHIAALVRVQRQAGQAEGLIEIVQIGVEGVIAAFAHAKHATAPAALLGLDNGVIHPVQQRAGHRGLKEQRHEVFKHGSIVADECLRATGHARIEPSQPVPVPHRYLPQHDGDKAEQPGFAGQQVVMTARGRVLKRMHANAEQVRLSVIEGVKTHALRQRVHTGGQAVIACAELGQQHAHILRTGQQTSRQVAAVHRRNERRLQRLQCARIIPVVKMPLPLWQLFERNEGFFHAAGHFVRREQAQPFRRRQGTQVQADVGGRGTVRHALVGLDLHIVGRQGVVRIGHGRFKEGKRSLGHAREHLAHIPGWALRLARGLLQIGQGEGKGGP